VPADYICESPLLGPCGLTRAEIEEEIGRWEMLGAQIASNLNFNSIDSLEVS
jgi:hypothetical protein